MDEDGVEEDLVVDVVVVVVVVAVLTTDLDSAVARRFVVEAAERFSIFVFE